jgi:hypothetical protein
MRLPSGEILPLRRRVTCGAIGSATLHELLDPTHDTAGHITDRLSVNPIAEPAPVASTYPPLAAGALLFVSNHEAENSRG